MTNPAKILGCWKFLYDAIHILQLQGDITNEMEEAMIKALMEFKEFAYEQDELFYGERISKEQRDG